VDQRQGRARDKKIDFVKVHAGWDEVVFLHGVQLPEGEELKIGLSLLRRPSLRGTEVGILYKPDGDGDLKVKILDITTNSYIDMCGGLTQALGKALIETDIGSRYGMRISEPRTRFTLETEAGLFPIEIDAKNGVATKITTDMQAYVEKRYRHGVCSIKVRGVNAVNVGIEPSRMEWLVFDLDDLKNKYPEVDFWRKDRSTLDVLKGLYEAFIEEHNLGASFLYGALYDTHPEGGGDARLLFRFLPTMYTPYYREDGCEEACGTGTIAVGMAMIEKADIQDSEREVLFELGSKRLIHKSQQVLTELRMKVREGRVSDAKFSHSLVEVVASGQVHV